MIAQKAFWRLIGRVIECSYLLLAGFEMKSFSIQETFSNCQDPFLKRKFKLIEICVLIGRFDPAREARRGSESKHHTKLIHWWPEWNA